MSKEIIASIRTIVGDMRVYSILCTVDSVDTNNNTCYCVPINGTADLVEVRLMAQNEKGFLLVPKVGSVVIVAHLSDSIAYVSMVSEVSEVQLNGSNYDGLVKINDLVTKLNNLENTLNTHITLYNNHVHSGGILVGGLTGVTSTLDTNTLTPTQKEDLENTTVLHGNGN